MKKKQQQKMLTWKSNKGLGGQILILNVEKKTFFVFDIVVVVVCCRYIVLPQKTAINISRTVYVRVLN